MTVLETGAEVDFATGTLFTDSGLSVFASGARADRSEVLCGDALDVLRGLPPTSVHCCVTSPPYWKQREYASGGLGSETRLEAYIDALCEILLEIKRVLTPQGSLWLNIGDVYRGKSLMGIPWRVAIKLMDEQGWILRNDVIWHKVKGSPDSSKDKLRHVYEDVFHFVKEKRCYYDMDAIRSKPRSAQVRNGAVVSATGVSGVRYRRQIELSTSLTDQEKSAALAALDQVLQDMALGKHSDFRMIIRGQQRVTHSDSESVSGRAKEIRDKGFYFLKFHPRGPKPSDVWDIIPEDTQGRSSHFAPFPEDLCRVPILATCPPGGVVLDPFCGTGTALAVARSLGRRAVGIDISPDYVAMSEERLGLLP
ncbi:MAG: site-specific DNA-methyltransferase [bacterium]|nr:site-specific DNA-methyltransferase [bacterium]MCY4257148.1 site-specific DNA-methyltransferase [bacterium]